MYATLDDLLAEVPETELVQLTDDEGTGVMSVPRIETALRSAAITVDGYVAAKYRTGALPVPPLLVELSRDIARYKLYRTSQAPERIEKAHDRALTQLAQIASGRIKLDDGSEEVAARPGAVLVQRPPRVFGRDDMAGF